MSKTPIPDKRARADLSLFVLALVDRGFMTPYSLRASVGLSPGASLPVLARLEKAGYVKRGRPEERRRTEYMATPQGRGLLRTGWKELLDSDVPSDIDSIFRVVALALLSGGSKKDVKAYLARAASSRKAEGLRKKGNVSAEPDGINDLYPWMRTLYGVQRSEIEVRVLKTLAGKINRLKLK